MTNLEISITRAYELYKAGHALRDSRMREFGILLVRLHKENCHQGARDGRSFAAQLSVLAIPRAVAYRAMRKADADFYERNIVRGDKVKSRRPRMSFREWLNAGTAFLTEGLAPLDDPADVKAARLIYAGLKQALPAPEVTVRVETEPAPPIRVTAVRVSESEERGKLLMFPMVKSAALRRP